MCLSLTHEVDVEKVELAIGDHVVDELLLGLEERDAEVERDGRLKLGLPVLGKEAHVAPKESEALLELAHQAHVLDHADQVDVGIEGVRVRLEHELLHVGAHVVHGDLVEELPLVALDVHLDHVDDLVLEVDVLEYLREAGQRAHLELVQARLLLGRQAEAVEAPARRHRQRDRLGQLAARVAYLLEEVGFDERVERLELTVVVLGNAAVEAVVGVDAERQHGTLARHRRQVVVHAHVPGALEAPRLVGGHVDVARAVRAAPAPGADTARVLARMREVVAREVGVELDRHADHGRNERALIDRGEHLTRRLAQHRSEQVEEDERHDRYDQQLGCESRHLLFFLLFLMLLLMLFVVAKAKAISSLSILSLSLS